MKAVIMAGGEGTRLRPITCTRPKPMINFFDRPVMEHTINLLKKHGIHDIAVALQYMPQIVMNYFGNGSDFGVNIKYFIEDTPLGTAGSIKNAENFLENEFVVISGDAVTDVNLTDAINFHHEKNAEATLILNKVDNPLEYGIVVTNEAGAVTRFQEKPDWSEVFTNTANTGIYILNSTALNTFNKGEKKDFSEDVFPELLAQNRAIFGFITESYWCDIGDTSAYISAHNDRFIHYISPKSTIAPNAYIGSPVFISDGAVIDAGASILPYSVIGANTKINENASIKGSILAENVRVGSHAQLRGCVICNDVVIGKRSNIFESAVIGSHTKIGNMTEIMPKTKIWANKYIGDNWITSNNVVWGETREPHLFGERAINGEINVDITPEFASRLGAAIGAKYKGKIGIGYGAGKPLQMLKNAFISGIISSGADVIDLNPTTLPIVRNATVFYSLTTGIYLSQEKNKVYAHILDENGINISPKDERSLEHLFARDDFPRTEPENIGKITEIKDYNTFYIQQIKGKSNMHIQINSDEAVIKNVCQTVLENMGVHVVENIASIPVININVEGESVDLIAENGMPLSKYQKLFLMLNILSRGEKTAVLPLDTPSVIVQYAKALGLKIKTSKTTNFDILKTLHEHHLNYQYGLMFDAVFFLSQLCQYMTDENITLADYIAQIPSVYVTKKEIACPQEKKGEIIHNLVQNEENATTKQGVKINKDKSWVLILPHKTKPLINVLADGASTEIAEELALEYTSKLTNNINHVINNPPE